MARKNMYVKDEAVHTKRPRFDAPPAYGNYAPPTSMRNNLCTMPVTTICMVPQCHHA